MKTPTRTLWTHTGFLILMFTLSLMYTTQAAAQNPEDLWDFSCDKGIRTPISRLPDPNILIVLDKSGSMIEYKGTVLIKDGNRLKEVWNTKWLQATMALSELLKANKQERIANFGLGLYSTHTSFPIGCGSSTEDEIQKELDASEPKGNTNTSAAITGAAKSATCHKNLKPNQASATLLITDGAPNDPGKALQAICEHRRVAPAYIVGLGTGTDKVFNNLAAAAGGTGSCIDSKSLSTWDPCQNPSVLPDMYEQTTVTYGVRKYRIYVMKDEYQGKYTCQGAFYTSRTDDLLQALKDISGKLSCTFPMSTGANTSIPEDPTNNYPYLRAEFTLANGKSKLIPYFNSQQGQILGADNSYSFANKERTSIQLGKAACEYVRKKTDEVQDVLTRYGCPCPVTPGDSCTIESWKEKNLCPRGIFECKEGKPVCSKLPSILTKTDEACSTGKYSHCSKGLITCLEDGTPRCDQISFPMPEICNGLDDDCDGVGDNMLDSWDPSGTFYSELKNHERDEPDNYSKLHRRACLGQNACICPGSIPPVDSLPPNMSFPDQLISYTDDWENRHGSCECVAD